jgi:hypothetical protein
MTGQLPNICLPIVGTLELYVSYPRTLVFLPISPTVFLRTLPKLSRGMVHQYAEHPNLVAGM